MGRFRYRLQPLLRRAIALERSAAHGVAVRLVEVRRCSDVLGSSRALQACVARASAAAAEFAFDAEWRERERTRLRIAQARLSDAQALLAQRRRLSEALRRHEARARATFDAAREGALERECEEQNALLRQFDRGNERTERAVRAGAIPGSK
jgi:PAS domain-containing protein